VTSTSGAHARPCHRGPAPRGHIARPCTRHPGPSSARLLATSRRLSRPHLALGIGCRYLLRLGHGEELLETEKDFSRAGRVNHMLKRRLELLVRVERLGQVVEATSDVGYTCETAQYFFHSHVLAKWEEFCANVAKRKAEGAAPVALLFPFTDFFADAPQPLFKGQSYEADLETARRCYKHLERLFEELVSAGPFRPRIHAALAGSARVLPSLPAPSRR
jgi:hypothetical protein